MCINVRAPSNCSALTSFSTCFCPYKLVTGPATPKPAGNRLQSLAKISEQSESLPITASTRPCRVEHEYPHIFCSSQRLHQASGQSFEEKPQRSTCDAALGGEGPESLPAYAASMPPPPDTDTDNGGHGLIV